MSDHKEHWTETMKAAPFTRSHFTTELRQQVLRKTKQIRPKRRFGTFAAALAVIVACGACLVFAGEAGELLRRLDASGTATTDTTARPAYDDDKGNRLLEVFPDPELKAGMPYGYLFHFTAPFEELQGRTLSIRATHLRSGYRLTAAQPALITEPSSGYDSLDRHTVAFALPLSGMWRYDVELDGRPYANVILFVQEPSWEISSAFRTGSYVMRGVSGKIGFIDHGFKAGSPQKYMWHFWGADAELDGSFEVKAVKQGEERIIDVFSAPELGGPNNGADRHTPSMMTLPEPGRWRLLPYVGGRLLDSIVVEVK